ncbi:Reverse transcriptase Ty1/copia-type domain-containing protein [Abeliophyllum distichum]|uniref:Reverse transcriptase Ty1/copia-type domain-containing protein n=1 Tax=Abeliophyllum distichum TaxID=126358 RepID=A0ABD1QWD9_9LAMI
MNEIAYSSIILNISDNIVRQVDDATAKELWKALDKHVRNVIKYARDVLNQVIVIDALRSKDLEVKKESRRNIREESLFIRGRNEMRENNYHRKKDREKSKGLAKRFWAEALCTATYLINRSPSSTVNFKMPQELWSGKSQDLSHIRVFGYAAYAHRVEVKLDPWATKCVMLEYLEGVKEYGLWVLGVKGVKIINSRDVKFNKLDMPCLRTSYNQVKQSGEGKSSTGKKIQTDVKRLNANQEVREPEQIDSRVETVQVEVLEQHELKIPETVIPTKNNLKILI